MASKKYEYDFIDKPSDKLKCLICLEVAADPKQHEKCGKIFCSECIEKCEGQPCPACKSGSANYFIDTRGAQEIRDLRIRCVNSSQGCRWQGTVGTLDEHMKMCEFEHVPCKYQYIGCDVEMARKDIVEHEKKDDTKHLHLALECVAIPTLSNGESLVIEMPGYNSLKRSKERFTSKPFYTHSSGYKMCLNIDASGSGSGEGTHLSLFFCLLSGPFDALLQWPFLGTVSVELLNQKNDYNHHRRDTTFTDNEYARPGTSGFGHLTFIPNSELLKEFSNTQYLKNDTLYFRVSVTISHHQPWLVHGKQTNAKISSLWKNSYQPHVFMLDGYASMKENNKTFCTSNFFVSPGGYQMYVAVYPNGNQDGKDTHVSLFIHSLKGPFDANLSWPIVGSIKFELLNQLADDDHHVQTLELTESTNMLVSGGRGFPTFISHEELQHQWLQSGQKQYLKDDALYFRVTAKVGNYKPWLAPNLCSERL